MSVESSPSHLGHVSILIARAIAHAVPKAIVPAVLKAGGLDTERLEHVDGYLSTEAETELWRTAVTLCDDPLLGLHAAFALRKGAFGALEYIAYTSATLEAALKRLARFARLLHGSSQFRYRPMDKAGASLVYCEPHAEDPLIADIVGDFCLGVIVILGSQALGRTLVPESTRLGRAAPSDIRPYKQVFGPRLEFGAPTYSLQFTSDILHAPMPNADEALCHILMHYVEKDLSSVEAEEGFRADVRSAIRGRIAEHGVAIGAVAEHLHVSERTLQRKLHDRGTSFSDELDRVRREMCLELLRQPNITIAGIALLLDYNEVSSFYRAFRRWTGSTPGAYRRALTAER